MKIRDEFIPVSRPNGNEQMVERFLETLESGWWGRGAVTVEFERQFAELVGARFALAVTSNSVGLDLAIRALGIAGSTIASPTMSFATTAVVPLWSGGSTKLIDIREDDLCIDSNRVDQDVDSSVDAVIAVNFAGHLAPVQEVRRVFGGFIIEDCAHSLFTPGAGEHSDVAVWSLHALKTAPVGDGGVVTTNDENLYEKLLSLSWFGIPSTYARLSGPSQKLHKGASYGWDYEIADVGLKAQMNDLTSTLAIGQIRDLDRNLKVRQDIQNRYNTELHWSVRRPRESATVQYYQARVAPETRNRLIDYLASKRIHTSVHYKPLHLHPLFECDVDYPVADTTWPQIISLPCFAGMSDDEVDYVIYWVNRFFEMG